MMADQPSTSGGRSPASRRRMLSLDEYEAGVRACDRSVLARAITLVESRNPRHRSTAQELLTRLLPHTGEAIRVGITGVPGVGKSTFIDTLGSNLTSVGRRLAVLAVDPSSAVSGGSILGDKTRMERLCTDRHAFIRPSPSAGTLGGVAGRTRETMLLCEAAGFDVVLVETVGVGQSETVVAEMTDVFLALMLPGAGDELQGIKRGLLELVDLIVVNKADGDNRTRAQQAARELRNALRFTHGGNDDRMPPVALCSATENHGVNDAWKCIEDIHSDAQVSGRLEARRKTQAVQWMWAMCDDVIRSRLHADPTLTQLRDDTEQQVRSGTLPPALGAQRLLEALGLTP
ncbi:MAG: methylmalonyl Co-A mutase-associated GTPase MeaB [Planctomycetota bacterium]